MLSLSYNIWLTKKNAKISCCFNSQIHQHGMLWHLGSNIKPGSENNIYSSGSMGANMNSHTYTNVLSGSSSLGANGGYTHKNNGGVSGGSATNGNPADGQNANTGAIDPHYVFGAPHTMPIIPNVPIFPYNSPTQAPVFQQFPQPNHPGNIYNPGLPQGLQPVNPYNPPFVFGQQPFYSAPAGTGGPPGGSNGILGSSSGGLAPYPGNYPSPNMYNKPPPQYQNQNPYNRQTQTYPTSAGRSFNELSTFSFITSLLAVILFSGIHSST